jgi:hypothetical protein
MAGQKSQAPQAARRKRAANEVSDVAGQDVDGEASVPRKKQKATPKDLAPVSSSATAAAEDGPDTVDSDSDTGETGDKIKLKIDRSLKPISDPREMMEDMVSRLKPETLKNSPIKLNVGTICSGTDAPISALNLLQDGLRALGYGNGIVFEQLFSCEIEPFKAGFIRRNVASGTPIFRDVVEMARAGPNGLA